MHRYAYCNRRPSARRGLTLEVTGAPKRCLPSRNYEPTRPVHRMVGRLMRRVADSKVAASLFYLSDSASSVPSQGRARKRNGLGSIRRRRRGGVMENGRWKSSVRSSAATCWRHESLPTRQRLAYEEWKRHSRFESRHRLSTQGRCAR
jgi:hypothetical protein